MSRNPLSVSTPVQNTIELTDTKLTFGPQAVLTLKGFEQKDASSDIKDNNMDGRVGYKIDEIGYQGKPVGSATAGPEFEEPRRTVEPAADQAVPRQDAAGASRCRRRRTGAGLQLTDAEQALVEANVNQLLAAKPHLALENLSLKTTHGESRFSLALDLGKPSHGTAAG